MNQIFRKPRKPKEYGKCPHRKQRWSLSFKKDSGTDQSLVGSVSYNSFGLTFTQNLKYVSETTVALIIEKTRQNDDTK